jgi:hypothetical protein
LWHFSLSGFRSQVDTREGFYKFTSLAGNYSSIIQHNEKRFFFSALSHSHLPRQFRYKIGFIRKHAKAFNMLILINSKSISEVSIFRIYCMLSQMTGTEWCVNINLGLTKIDSAIINQENTPRVR